VEYATSEGTFDGLEAAADALVTAYNSLSFEDEFNRVMEDVTILSTTTSESGPGRDLQISFVIFALLEVLGSCRACESNSFYSNQIIPARKLHAIPASSEKTEPQLRRQMSKGQGSKRSNKSSKRSSGKGSSSSKNNMDVLIQGLPSEEDILSSYSDEIMDSDVDFGNIVDVLSIVELAENPLE
jgi:uncharacterized membrane protein YgcG